MTLNEVLQQLVSAILHVVPAILAAVVVFIIGLFVAAWLAKMLQKTLERRNVRRELVILFSRLLRWSVIIAVAILALQMVGFNVSAFIAGLGVTGLVIGFALQDISRNFTSGVLLMIQEPFSLGDYISVAGHEGEVIDIQMRATELMSLDGLRILIPNGDVFTSTIINYTKINRRRVSLDVGVAYDTDLQKASDVALHAIRAVPGLLNDPPPVLFFHNFGESSIDFTIRYWFDTAENDIFTAMDIGVRAIKQAFDREGIEIPYPIRSVYLSSASDSSLRS